MLKFKAQVIAGSAAILLAASSVFAAQTWRLSPGGELEVLSAEKDKYLLAVSEIKKLVNTGQTKAVTRAVGQLKKDFPEIAGPDLDAFVEADMLFCKGKFTKAVRSYDKFLAQYPESELYEAVLDREFAIATAYLAGQKRKVLGVFKMRGYATGERIMERLIDRLGDVPLARRAGVAVAESLELRGKFDDAYQQWYEILSRWATGQFAQQALLGMARCKHAAYKGPKYDVSNLISAKSYYEDFRLRYPDRADELQVSDRLRQIDEQLAYKEFSTARYYQRTGAGQAANLYYQMVFDNWPRSKAAKIADQKMSKEQE
jgi:outer membrane protein assembly factor BamD (BamD/ComL family)